jgi:hypothetical protein
MTTPKQAAAMALAEHVRAELVAQVGQDCCQGADSMCYGPGGCIVRIALSRLEPKPIAPSAPDLSELERRVCEAAMARHMTRADADPREIERVVACEYDACAALAAARQPVEVVVRGTKGLDFKVDVGVEGGLVATFYGDSAEANAELIRIALCDQALAERTRRG